MKEAALVIMAAGMGSRFGGGIKQLANVGPSGEIIMDYSIYDAKAAGFTKVVFIIRKDLEAIFKEVIGNRMEKILPVEYAFQEGDDLPAGFQKPEGRTKPWGTGQAVLACRNLVKCPFVVINADDYYGSHIFRSMYQFLSALEDMKKADFCMGGFVLKNTLSENGTVTRGVCQVSEDGFLTNVRETGEIALDPDGVVRGLVDGSRSPIPADSYVSMNMWGFTPVIFSELETRFVHFLETLGEDALKKEYLLPIIVDQLIKEKKADVKVLETPDRWFGVTYAEDKATVTEAFRQMAEEGKYRHPLFA